MKKRTKRLKILKISHELLLNLIRQEYDDQIAVVDVSYSFDYDAWHIKLEHPDWPKVGEGELIPNLEPQMIFEAKSVRYDELVAAILDHYDGGPMPESFAEHARR